MIGMLKTSVDAGRDRGYSWERLPLTAPLSPLEGAYGGDGSRGATTDPYMKSLCPKIS